MLLTGVITGKIMVVVPVSIETVSGSGEFVLGLTTACKGSSSSSLPLVMQSNKSGDKICWVGHKFKAGHSEAKTECANQGFQGLAEARTENDWGFMSLIDACKNIKLFFQYVINQFHSSLLFQSRLYWFLYYDPCNPRNAMAKTRRSQAFYWVETPWK